MDGAVQGFGQNVEEGGGDELQQEGNKTVRHALLDHVRVRGGRHPLWSSTARGTRCNSDIPERS